METRGQSPINHLTRPNLERPKERPPDAICERPAVARSNLSFSRQALHRAVDNGAEFGGVPLLASPFQSPACIVNAEPGGVAVCFLRRLGVSDFQHESLHDEFLDDIAQPGVAFWLQVEVEMLRLYDTNGPGLLQRLALRGLAVRQSSRSGSLGKSPPVATGGLDQQKVERGAAPSVANRRH